MKDSEQTAFKTATTQRANNRKKVLSFSTRGVIAIASAILFLTTVTWTSYQLFLSSPADSNLELLTDLDLSEVEIQVADKIRSLRAEVQKKPHSAESWGSLGMTLDIHDFKTQAVPCYKKASELDPHDFRWTYYCAVALSDLGSEEAVQWFQRSRGLRPDYAPLYTIYGQLLLDLGQLDKARETFERAIQIDETTVQAHVGLGKIALAQGELNPGHHHLLQALKIAPQNREAHGILAEIYRRQGDTEKANRELEIAQDLPKISPLHDPVYEELVAKGISAFWYRERGLVYQAEGRLDEAIREFQTALQLKPDPEGHNYVGNLLKKQGRYEEAASHYRTALSLSSNYFTASTNLAQTLFEMGQVEEAIVWAKRSLQLNPRLPSSYITLGTFYMRSGQPAQAVDVFRQGLLATGNFPPIALRLAWLLATADDPQVRDGKEALRLARLITEGNKIKDAETLDVLAAAYAEHGQFTQATRTAHQALKLARETSQNSLASQIQHRLALFRSSKPYRQKSPPDN